MADGPMPALFGSPELWQVDRKVALLRLRKKASAGAYSMGPWWCALRCSRCWSLASSYRLNPATRKGWTSVTRCVCKAMVRMAELDAITPRCLSAGWRQAVARRN